MIIGTAGHVDHGKTALIRALTGQDTDRLPEEKARGISIDLGFAECTLPDGRRAGMVDVPGHERFIRNMVAGAAGIDLALLVVAADEGIMPQTREHLDILQLLGVRTGLVALTKKDLVEPDWRALVAEEVRTALAGTFLAGAPQVAVSAHTGEGLDELVTEIARLVPDVAPRDTGGHPRLPIDRAFSVAGFGTVVTGTLLSGTVAPEDRLELLPAGSAGSTGTGGLTVRVRQVQVHGRKVERAEAGQRVALNLAGVDRDQVERGQVLAAPDILRPGLTFAGEFTLLPGAPRSLESGVRVHLHTGTAEALGRVLLLDRESLSPGETAFVQFKAESPLVVARGDRFIVRGDSPVTTLGGGVVLDAIQRYKRHNPRGLEALRLLASGDRGDLLVALLPAGRPVAAAELARRAGLPWPELVGAAAALERAGRLIAIGGAGGAGGGGEWVIAAAAYDGLRARLADFLGNYHQRYPLRPGAPREEVRAALWPDLEVRAANALLERLREDGHIRVEPDAVALAGRAAAPPPEWAEACRAVEAAYLEGGVAPPTPGEVAGRLAALLPTGGSGHGGGPVEASEIFHRLLAEGILVKLGEELYFHRRSLEAAAERVRAHLAERGTITVAELRDLLNTTRRFAVPLAEYFDRVRLTRRVGDERRLA